MRYGLIARRHGVALFQGVISIVAMMVMCSMAVDIGMYYLARCELQRSADSAALAAGAMIDDGYAAAWQEAVRFATADNIAGQTLLSNAVSMRMGRWTNGQLNPSGTPVDAVEVTLKRSQTTGNPLKLYFGNLFGVNSVNVAATSTVKLKPKASEFNFVGIDEARFSSLGVLARITGRIVSNGDVRIGMPLGILVGVQGDARSHGGAVKKGVLAHISGSTAMLDDELVYPSVTTPATNDNSQIQSYLNGNNDFNAVGSATIPAGVYHVRNLNFIAGLNIRIEGNVTFYVEGDCNLAVGVNLLGNSNFDPSMFKVRVLPGGNVNFLANILTPLNMDMYAPDSDIVIAVGVNRYYGRLIGKTLNIALPILGNFEEDADLEDPNKGSARLSLVR